LQNELKNYASLWIMHKFRVHKKNPTFMDGSSANCFCKFIFTDGSNHICLRLSCLIAFYFTFFWRSFLTVVEFFLNI